MLANELPVKDRLLICSSASSQVTTVGPSAVQRRPAAAGYKNWTEENLHKAYLTHVKEGTSVRRAAEMYGVPKSTLQDGVTGRVPFGPKVVQRSF